MEDFTTKNHPVLYSFRRCPYAVRGRMGLYKAGIAVELREIELKNKPDEMLDASPKGTVPILVLQDGTVIDKSLDIMQWALEQNDPGGLLDADQAETCFLLDRNDHKFKPALDRYKYPNRYPKEDCSWARDACEETCKDMEERLNNHKQLAGNHVTLADIAIFPFIRQCANVDREWFDSLPYKELQRWLDGHLESALFKAVMVKFKIWTQGDPPIILTPMTN